MLQFSHVGIIGAGDIGSALGDALTHRSGLQVLYYDKDPARTTTGSIEDLVRACPVLLMCVPSWANKEVAKQIKRHAHPNEARLVITLSKGVAPGFVTMDTLLQAELPKHYAVGVMYGPMIAEEIRREHAAHAVIALNNTTYIAPLQAMFEDSDINIEVSGDIHGLTLCATLKNVYAMAFGICDGLRLGWNAKGRLAVMALAEMKGLLGALGGDPRTAEGTGGLGDLLSTSFSGDSFNYRVGKSLAEGMIDPHVRSEGLVSINELGRALKLAPYPIAHLVEQAAFHYAKPTQLKKLLQ